MPLPPTYRTALRASQVPMFTASGLHVRSLKVFERNNYQTTKWVRYQTRAGSYQIRIGA
jgi:AP-2 complex subunit mu-1